MPDKHLGPDIAPLSNTMQRAVDALRSALKAVYHVEPNRDEEQLAAVAEQLNSLMIDAGTMGLGQPSPERHTRNPLSGAMNPIAPPVTYSYGENSITATVRFHEGYQGPPACVHGGIVAALLDDALGRTRHLTGRNCVTGSLDISYKRPTPLNADLVVEARIDEILERKFLVTGEILHEGQVTASAKAVFVFLDDKKFNALVSDARQASK
jgi:acyl-coenzyme A thioesterase PaaI-like protein